MWEKLFMIFAMLGTLLLILRFLFPFDLPGVIYSNFYLIMGIDLLLTGIFYLLSLHHKNWGQQNAIPIACANNSVGLLLSESEYALILLDRKITDRKRPAQFGKIDKAVKPSQKKGQQIRVNHKKSLL